MDTTEYRIEVLSGSFEAFGMVMDLMSHHAPFADWPLSRLAKAIRRQLRQGRQIGALSPSNELIAYAGWTPTLQASAELWVADRGPLKVLERGFDAMAMTIVVSPQPGVAKALMRKARDLNPGARWFFKRSYAHQLRIPRKTVLFDRTGRQKDSSGA